jgi:hypothetical protein
MLGTFARILPMRRMIGGMQDGNCTHDGTGPLSRLLRQLPATVFSPA